MGLYDFRIIIIRDVSKLFQIGGPDFCVTGSDNYGTVYSTTVTFTVGVVTAFNSDSSPFPCNGYIYTLQHPSTVHAKNTFAGRTMPFSASNA